MKFTKMHGCGNDYIYINCFEKSVTDIEKLAPMLSDRHYGIGGDGVILIEPSEIADARMRMYNLDGSEGEMCGNGIRCLAKYISDHGIIPDDRKSAVIQTKTRLIIVDLHRENGLVDSVTVDMGKAVLASELPEDIEVAGLDLKFIGMDIGNPHAVYFLDDNYKLDEMCDGELENIPLESIGERFEKHKRFPEFVNSEFIKVINRGEIQLRVWERGSGETLACGTGSSAAVAAGNLAGKLDSEVLVHLKGGNLRIKYNAKNGHCTMTGPAVEVFSGEIDI